MNTAKTLSLCPPVGQLAKTPIFLLKPNENGALQVGRHVNKCPRTSAPTQGAHTGDFKEQTAVENKELFDLQAMTYLNHLFTGIQPQTKVVFHNLLYVEQLQEGFLPHECDIFMQFVKTFAQFRCHAQNSFNEQGIILTTDHDFYLAFKLMKKRKLSDYQDIKPKNKNKILDLIKLKFKNRTFTPQIIAKELFYNYAFIHRILALLILEREIEFVKVIAGQKSFRLREKTPVHVVESLDTQLNQVNHVVS